MKFIIKWNDRKLLLCSNNDEVINNFINKHYPDRKGITIADDNPQPEIQQLKDELGNSTEALQNTISLYDDLKDNITELELCLAKANDKLSEHTNCKDKLHRRNMQIKDLKIELKIDKKIKDRFNSRLCDVKDCLNSYSPTIIDLAVKIRQILNR